MLLARLNVAFQLCNASVDLVFAHEDGAKRHLVILQVLQLLQVVNSLGVTCTATLLKLMTLLNRLQDCLDLQHFVLEPHFDVNEGVCHGFGQIVKVFLQVLIFRVLEEKLLLRQLAFLGQILLAAKICVDFGAVGQH